MIIGKIYIYVNRKGDCCIQNYLGDGILGIFVESYFDQFRNGKVMYSWCYYFLDLNFIFKGVSELRISSQLFFIF